MASQANQIAWNTNSPSGLSDLNYWQVGDIVFNNGVTISIQQALGWVCTAAGFPGTWQVIAAQPLIANTTTATSGTLTNGYRFQVLNPASTGTYSLPSAAANVSGSVVTIKNVASGSTTLAPIAANGYIDAAAITLAQYASITLFTNGSTNWYKMA